VLGECSLSQSDATAWMAFYCGTMLSMALELAKKNRAYEDMASKFFEHFIAISDAMNFLGGTGLWDERDGFDFRIFDSPDSLESAIRQKAAEGLSARMSAGFCWPWSYPNPDGTLKNDVIVGDYQRPWNARPEARILASDIPKSNLWANDPNGVNQVGCVYTAQGFEFDYAGVIFGNDLTYSFDEQAWKGQPENSQDTVVKRSKDKFVDLAKNTYRVLLSRGMKGCYIHFVDKDTERFFKTRIEKNNHG